MKKILQLQIFQFTRSLIVALLLVVGLSFAYAWTGPTAPAPGNNTDAPINVATTSQVKAGGLWVNALGVTKNAIIGKVQLDDVVVEGTACGVLNPDGTISRNVVGETLACVSGIWTKVGGGTGGVGSFVAADITIPATGTYDFNSYLPAGVTPSAIQVSASVGDNAGTQCCSHSAKLTVDGKVVSGFHRYTNNTGSGPNGPVTYEDWGSLIVTPGTHTVVYTTSHNDVAAQFKITGYFLGSGSPPPPPAPTEFIYNKTISSDVANYNLKADALLNGWDGVLPLNATVTINAGVAVYSTTPVTPAFDTGSGFPAGSSLRLINNGFIYGAGGTGARGGGKHDASSDAWHNPESGGTGGTALRAQAPISATNNGTIAGGGGGGGAGNFTNQYDWGGTGSGGGGGQGRNGGSRGGPSGWGASCGAGGSGSVGGPGAGGTGCPGGNGGAGGTFGNPGQAASGGGGAAGYAASGNSNITWTVSGTRLGPLN